jgi:hypothetical protein
MWVRLRSFFGLLTLTFSVDLLQVAPPSSTFAGAAVNSRITGGRSNGGLGGSTSTRVLRRR